MRFAFSLPGAGSAKRLAGEPAANNICCGWAKCSDVVVTRDAGPVLSEDCPAVGIDFAEGDGSHSGSLEPEGEAADAAEEIEDTHHLRAADRCSVVARIIDVVLPSSLERAQQRREYRDQHGHCDQRSYKYFSHTLLRELSSVRQTSMVSSALCRSARSFSKACVARFLIHRPANPSRLYLVCVIRCSDRTPVSRRPSLRP